ncbi:MAG: hypothetical protein PHH40_00010 [Candidatus Moranbacteria bacterium]|nr:hypothetical protein [Candidatus Moranbacteria bacterium]MDD3965256.1 hypothetical protein [Candidatus Moranbacteria bacterium]
MQSEKSSFARFGSNTYSAHEKNTASSGVPLSSVGTGGSEQSSSQKEIWFDKVISVALVALFFGLPLFFTGMTFQGIAFEKQIYFYFWLLIGIVAWSSKGVVTGELRIRRTPLDIPILLFWLFSVVTAFFSVDRWHSFWGFFGDPSRGVISITALILAYYLLLSHFSARRFLLMFWSFILSGALLVIWSTIVLMDWSFLPVAWEQYVPMSLLGTISGLGIMLALLVPMFLTALFVIQQNQGIKKKQRRIITGLLLSVLALTLFLLLALYPFVSWIVVLGGLSFFLVYILAQIIRPKEQWVLLPMIVFVAVLIFLMIGDYGSGLVRTTLPIEATPNTTLSWQIARDTLKENFFFGVGPANYGHAFSMFRSEAYNLNSLYTLRFYQGTGLFYEALATIGIIGTVLFLILWLSFVSVGFYLLSYEKNRNKIYSLGLWSVVTMLFLASFVSAVNGPILLIGALLSTLALGTVLWESQSEERYLQLSLKASPKFALALAFIFMVVSAGVAFLFVFIGKVFVADMNAGQAVRASVSAPSDDSARSLGSAIQMYPQEGRYYMRLAQEYMALANVEAGKAEKERNIDTIATYVNQSVSIGEQGKKLMPNDVQQIESLGLIYENASLYATNALTTATDLYARALELEPENPLYSVKLGQIKKLQADGKEEGAERENLYKESRDLFQKAINQKKDLAPAYYNLALVFSRLKNFDQAVEKAQQALAFDNKNLNYGYNLGVLYQVRDQDGDQKRAEKMFQDILSVNEKLIDVRLSLGLLYESMEQKNDAIEEYKKILGFLSKDDSDTVIKTREQVQTLIDNVRSGTGNIKQGSTSAVSETETAPVSTPQTPTLETPVTPETSLPVGAPLPTPAP